MNTPWLSAGSSLFAMLGRGLSTGVVIDAKRPNGLGRQPAHPLRVWPKAARTAQPGVVYEELAMEARVIRAA